MYYVNRFIGLFILRFFTNIIDLDFDALIFLKFILRQHSYSGRRNGTLLIFASNVVFIMIQITLYAVLINNCTFVSSITATDYIRARLSGFARP